MKLRIGTRQQVRAWMCPNCTALLSESLVGKPALLPSDGWLCAECGEINEFREWACGVWKRGA